MMNQELGQWFFSEVAAKMSFLVEDFAFQSPELHIDEAISFAYVYYRGKELAIEFLLDERDEHFECRVSRLRNGAFQDDDWNYRNDQGDLSRKTVFEIARSRAREEDLFHRTSGLAFKDKIPVWLGDYEHMLRTHCQDVLADSPRVFRE